MIFIQLWVAGIDDALTAEGIISPGLGDSVCLHVLFVGARNLTLQNRVTVYSTHLPTRIKPKVYILLLYLDVSALGNVSSFYVL